MKPFRLFISIVALLVCTSSAWAAPEGTLTVAVATFGNERWLPNLYVGAEDVVLKPMFENLLTRDAKGELAPSLAERFEKPSVVFGNKVNHGLFASMAFIQSKRHIETAGEQGAERQPSGTGPWKFVEHVRGDRIVYEAVILGGQWPTKSTYDAKVPWAQPDTERAKKVRLAMNLAVDKGAIMQRPLRED